MERLAFSQTGELLEDGANELKHFKSMLRRGVCWLRATQGSTQTGHYGSEETFVDRDAVGVHGCFDLQNVSLNLP